MSGKKLVAILLLSASVWLGVLESACPDEEAIAPCRCVTEDVTDKLVLECSNITHVLDLEKAAQNSDGYRYDKVLIETCTLQYIPKVVPETIRTSELVLRNLTLTRLFNDIPNSLDELTFVELDGIKTLSSFSWEYFQNTPRLTHLYVYHLNNPVINEDINNYVTHNLQELHLESSGTREIEEGAFRGFQKMFVLSLDNNKLESLRRDSFPEECNIQLLYLKNNRLTTIPDDFSVGMLKLSKLDLRGNFISRINEDPFGTSLTYVVELSGNPIKCDCYIQWIINKRRFKGYCASPKRLAGKEFVELSDGDLDC